MNLPSTYVDCSKQLKAIADTTRLNILNCLFEGEFTVTEIADSIDIDYSQVSHHLGVLRNAGLIVDKKDGKNVIYKIHPSYLKRNIKKNSNVIDLDCCSIEFNMTSNGLKISNNKEVGGPQF